MKNTPAQYLIEAGMIYPGAKVCDSKPHLLLMQLAEKHTQYMADSDDLGHTNFQERYDEIRTKLGLSATEIAAETWSDNSADTPMEHLAEEMYQAWEGSRGHWNVVKKAHKFAGFAMIKSKKRNVWYATILVAD